MIFLSYPTFVLWNFILKGNTFLRLNLVKGYYQVVVNKASRKKRPFGTFQLKLMSFGLKIRVQLFKDKWIKFWGIWILFLFIWTIFWSVQGPRRKTEPIFSQVNWSSLAVATIDTHEIRPSPKHTAAIQNYPIQQTNDKISCFLGLLNFFQGFIPLAVWGSGTRNSC